MQKNTSIKSYGVLVGFSSWGISHGLVSSRQSKRWCSLGCSWGSLYILWIPYITHKSGHGMGLHSLCPEIGHHKRYSFTISTGAVFFEPFHQLIQLDYFFVKGPMESSAYLAHSSANLTFPWQAQPFFWLLQLRCPSPRKKLGLPSIFMYDLVGRYPC